MEISLKINVSQAHVVEHWVLCGILFEVNNILLVLDVLAWLACTQFVKLDPF